MTLKRSLLSLLLLALPALAQDFELDISEDADEPKTSEELKPTLAILSVRAADKDDTSGPRARQLQAEFLKQLANDGRFASIVAPDAAKIQLGGDYAKFDACTTDYSCFEEAARQLKVHRVVRLTVEKRGPGSQVEMYGYDPGFAEILHVGQDSGEKAEKTFFGVAGKSQAKKDQEFLKKMVPFLKQVQRRLATPNGNIHVDNADPGALVSVDNAQVGAGTLDFIAPRGVHTVKVTSAGYKPFEQHVTVEPGKELTVKVTLEAIPLDPSAPKVVEAANPKTAGVVGGSVMAVVGAAAVVTGVILVVQAQAVAKQLNGATPGAPVTVSRADAKAAPTKNIVGDVLMGVGGAAMAGGITWVAVTLAPEPPRGTIKAIEPTESTTGAMIYFGGSF